LIFREVVRILSELISPRVESIGGIMRTR
jgi:hypothetical protein